MDVGVGKRCKRGRLYSLISFAFLPRRAFAVAVCAIFLWCSRCRRALLLCFVLLAEARNTERTVVCLLESQHNAFLLFSRLPSTTRTQDASSFPSICHASHLCHYFFFLLTRPHTIGCIADTTRAPCSTLQHRHIHTLRNNKSARLFNPLHPLFLVIPTSCAAAKEFLL